MALLLVPLTALACQREKPVPPPSASPTPMAGGLRPLTSRDAASPTASPLGEGRLPPGHPPVEGAAPTDAPAPAGEAVSGTITIAPKLQPSVSPSDVLYVIARSSATKQVVAVRREAGVRFPHSFTISAADVMVAGTPFQGPFDLTARLSKSGDAIAAKGDIEGSAKGIAAGSKNAQVMLDTVRQ